MRIGLANKWIKCIDDQIIGTPQSHKGSGDNWIPVIPLGSAKSGLTEEHYIKDPEKRICYIMYTPKGVPAESVRIEITKN